MRDIDTCIRQFEAGQISRRDFVKTLLAAGLSLTAINTILAGSGSKAMASTPKKGGRVIAAFTMHSPNDTLDPARSTSDIDGMRLCLVYNVLVRATRDLEPEGQLVESWEPNKTGDEWIFRLRKGVEWHDGKDFTAEDVLYTLRRTLDVETASPGRAVISDIEENELRADGRHTVRIKLKKPNVDFPIFFSAYHLNVIREGTNFEHPVGTGPFRVKEFKPGIHLVVERNPNYWKSGLPYVDEVETFGIGDQTTRLNALLGGEIHYCQDLNSRMISKVKETPGVEVLTAMSGVHAPFGMDCRVAPYSDVNVRNALKCLIDREEYVKTVYQGYAHAGNDHPVAPFMPDYCQDLPIRQYDPDKTKSLLKKAGQSKTTFELHTMEGIPGSLDGALVYQQMAAKAGVNIKVVRAPSDGYWDHTWMKKAFFGCLWQTRPAANMILSIVYKSDAPWNETRWKRPDFDKLLIEARGTLDKAKRKELYCAMQRVIHEDGGSVIPAFINILDASSTKLKAVLHPMRPYDVELFETCWLET